MKGIPPTNIVYGCLSCEGTEFKIYISYENDRTYIVTVCANEECDQQRRKELKAGPDDLVYIDEFDITGQGRDPKDLPEEFLEELQVELEDSKSKRILN